MRMRAPTLIAALLLSACASRSGATSARSPGSQQVAGGGKALMVVGAIPLVGTDVVIRDALRARNLDVEEVRETMATAGDAEGKRVVILSFSMLSTGLRANLADAPVPIIVLEHFLLDDLGMTADGRGHGFQQNLTQISIVSDDRTLTAGLPPGELTVYSRVGEMFWGVPGPGAIKVATVKGSPERSFYFAYPQGAMMVSRPAPGKRVHFFFAVHSPPPVPTLYLNDNGLKLLGGAIDWSLQ
jgi:hypothetical protein